MTLSWGNKYLSVECEISQVGSQKGEKNLLKDYKKILFRD